MNGDGSVRHEQFGYLILIIKSPQKTTIYHFLVGVILFYYNNVSGNFQYVPIFPIIQIIIGNIIKQSQNKINVCLRKFNFIQFLLISDMLSNGPVKQYAQKIGVIN